MNGAFRSIHLLVTMGLLAGCGSPPVANGPQGNGAPASSGSAVAPISTANAAENGPLIGANAADFAMLSMGERESCRVTKAGQVQCWGLAGAGPGAVSLKHRDAPTLVPGIDDAAQVSVGVATLVRHKTGAVTCFGCTSALKDAVDVAAGRQMLCTVSAAGAVLCGAPWETLQPVAGVSDAVDVAVGGAHACAVRKTGGVACWGSNTYGQLGAARVGPDEMGDESDDPGDKPPLVQVKGIDDAVAVGAGPDHTCVLRSSGKLACWGDDHNGALGDGPDPDDGNVKLPPPGSVREVVGISDAVGLSETGRCALRKGGVVSCWGSNFYGEIGGGTRADDADSPVQIKGLPAVVAIQLNGGRTCAVDASGGLYCWGDLGRALPSPVVGLNDAIAVDVGGEMSCAIRKGGALVCWGANDGFDKDQVPYRDSLVPEDRYKIADAVALSMPRPPSHVHDVCVVRAAGEVVCIDRGEVFRPGVTDATAVAVGQSIACALRRGGSVSCWHGNRPSKTNKVVEDIAVSGAVSIAAAEDTACAPIRTGSVTCWGNNSWGMLGDGSSDPRATQHGPGPVKNLSDAVAISMGFTHACAIKKGGEVVCWGSNLRRVSDVKDLDILTPSKTSMRDAKAISAGMDGVCALRATGAVSCWGNMSPRGMDRDTLEGERVTDVQNLPDAAAIALGGNHACAIKKGGQVVCWGDNSRGQLGNGTGPATPKPFPMP